MMKSEGILLNSHFLNMMKVGGESGWFYRESNSASTGYTWSCIPDNSGVYEMIEEVVLHASTPAVGVPGAIIWKFMAVRAGKGTVLFELRAPGSGEVAERIAVTIEASK